MEEELDGIACPKRAAGGPCCRRLATGGAGTLVEPAALGALLAGGGHGYDLRRVISEKTGGRLDVDPGGLYRVLRRLEADGFVVSRWEESNSGPARREYELTAEGRELATSWLTNLRERQQMTGALADVLEASLHNA